MCVEEIFYLFEIKNGQKAYQFTSFGFFIKMILNEYFG